MDRTTLLVLGGGEDQLPAYLEGRRLGCHVVGVDGRADALAAAHADDFAQISTRDPQAILAWLAQRDLKPDGVISPASDVAQPAVAELSRLLGTPYQPSAMAVRASVDKGYFRSVVDELGLPGYRYEQCTNLERLREAGTGIGYPLIVKPSDASGSRGLTLVTREAALVPALELARECSHDHRVVIEEVVAGRHCSVESFLDGGVVRFMAVTDRELCRPPQMISVSHVLPAELDEAFHLRLQEVITQVCAAIGHRTGPVNLDFVLAGDGRIHLIEMGARLGGNGMPLLMEQVFGVNTVEAAIRLSLGRPFDLTPTRQRAALLRILHSDTDGVLTRLGDLAAVRELPEVVEVRMFYAPGDPVRAYTQAANKLGYLIVAAPSREGLPRALERALALLQLEVQAHDR